MSRNPDKQADVATGGDPVGLDPLYRPFELDGLRLRNRLIMAPMTRERAPGGVATAEMAAYYQKRAAGGVGLVITEGTPPDAAGAFGAHVPRFFGEDALDAWKPIVDAVHAEGAAIMPQLWHVGAGNPSLVGMTDSLSVSRVSPSGLAGPGVSLGSPMTQKDLERTIDAFAAAAAAARRIGFDGVEIHGAHGYLIDQFFWEQTNRRTDAFGYEARTRFAAELVAECRSRVGPDFPISMRLSQWKQLDYAARLADTPQEWAALLEPMVEAGVDIFHCSTRRFWEPAFAGSEKTLAGWTRQLSGRSVIAVGSVTLANDFKSEMGKVRAEPAVRQLGRLVELMEAGEFDLVALGRSLLANPDWPRVVREHGADRLHAFTKTMLDELF